MQHARAVDHDNNAATAALDAVESVTLTFLDYPDLDAFITALGAGTNAYLTGTSDDAEASFRLRHLARGAGLLARRAGRGRRRLRQPQGLLRESVTVREPVVTLNTNGTGTVRDGGADGAVRQLHGADFAIAADGRSRAPSFGPQLIGPDGSLVSRNDYVNGTFRQTKQRGGDGVVVRENADTSRMSHPGWGGR